MKNIILKSLFILTFALSASVGRSADQTLGETVAQQVKDNLLKVLKNCSLNNSGDGYVCHPTGLQLCTLFDDPNKTQEEIQAGHCVVNGYLDNVFIKLKVGDSDAKSGELDFELNGKKPLKVTYDENNLVALLDIGEYKSFVGEILDIEEPGHTDPVFDGIPNSGQLKLSLSKGAESQVKIEVPVAFDFNVNSGANNTRIKLGAGSTILLGAGASNRSDIGFKLVDAIIAIPEQANQRAATRIEAELLSMYAAVNEINERFELNKLGATNVKLYKDGALHTSLSTNGAIDGKIYFSTPGGAGLKLEVVNNTKLNMTVEPKPMTSSLPIAYKNYTLPEIGEGTYVFSADAGTYLEQKAASIADIATNNIQNQAHSFDSGTGTWRTITGYNNGDPIYETIEDKGIYIGYNLNHFVYQMTGVDVAFHGASGSYAAVATVGGKILGSIGSGHVTFQGSNIMTFNQTAGGSNNEMNLIRTFDGTNVFGTTYFKNNSSIDFTSTSVKKTNVGNVTFAASAGTTVAVGKGFNVKTGSLSMTNDGSTPLFTDNICADAASPGASCTATFGPDPNAP